MGGWSLVQGKRGKRKARAPLLPSGAEAPRKTRKGGTAAEPSALPTGAFHPLVPAGDDVAASVVSLPVETSDGAPPAPLPPTPPAMPEASVASGASGVDPGVAGGELRSIFEEIEALGLTPVTQGEDDPLPAGLDLADLTPASPSPCSILLTAVSAPASEGPLDSLTCPAAGGTPLTAAEPVEATAGATRSGPELPGESLVGVGQPSSFPGGDPIGVFSPPDAVADPSAIEPEPGISGDPLSTPQTPESELVGPPSAHPAHGARDPAFVPPPGPPPDPGPVPSTPSDIIAAPGAVSFPSREDDPQGAASVFPCPDLLGAAILPPPLPIDPGSEADYVALVHQAPRRGSAPCLSVSVGHGAVPGAPLEDNRGLAPPPPHTLREELREFLEDVRGSRNKDGCSMTGWLDPSDGDRTSRQNQMSVFSGKMRVFRYFHIIAGTSNNDLNLPED
ncbi:myelin protein zero-like protein 3 [Platysternon megacephalum]|uniref:Myelin protein zero-like protein 3 n=1 Tax=Platysternon megacephalum TaxID=55544 RepID=A0A4D9E8P7_9SAUR|nr:myelin protein zero-like protein 3 [Platysternon megacephalum]